MRVLDLGPVFNAPQKKKLVNHMQEKGFQDFNSIINFHFGTISKSPGFKVSET
jgi:hypothetical protein